MIQIKADKKKLDIYGIKEIYGTIKVGPGELLSINSTDDESIPDSIPVDGVIMYEAKIPMLRSKKEKSKTKGIANYYLVCISKYELYDYYLYFISNERKSKREIEWIINVFSNILNINPEDISVESYGSCIKYHNDNVGNLQSLYTLRESTVFFNKYRCTILLAVLAIIILFISEYLLYMNMQSAWNKVYELSSEITKFKQ